MDWHGSGLTLANQCSDNGPEGVRSSMRAMYLLYLPQCFGAEHIVFAERSGRRVKSLRECSGRFLDL